MKIGFFGLGNMGGPMANNLLKAGYHVGGYDVQAQALERFEEAGGRGQKNIPETCRNMDIIISMLPSGKISKELYLGEEGILKHTERRTLLIDCSTIAPGDAKELAQGAQQAGFRMIDAPVSGGVAGALAGTLTFIVGGKEEDLAAAREVLQVMGGNIFHAGTNGAGQAAKVCNNMLLAIHMIGSAEALNLGVALGLSPNVLSEILKKSSGNNWSLQKYNPYPGVMEKVPASRNYQGGFGVDLMVKDLNLALEACEKSGISASLGKMAGKLYSAHQSAGNGKLDFSSIIKAKST